MSQSPPLRRTALAAEIRAEMGRQRVSVADLAHSTGIRASTLYRRLNGVKPLLVDELDAISIALGVEPYELTARAKAVA